MHHQHINKYIQQLANKQTNQISKHTTNNKQTNQLINQTT